MSSSAPSSTQLILVRHGETEGNVSQVWHGALDAPLTARGQRQVVVTAAALAAWHAQRPVDALYVSPLPRAQSTAAAIAAAIGLAPQVEADLREFDLGEWEGRSFRELREVEDLWGKWAVNPAFAPPGGESPIIFNRRATATLARLAAAHPGQRLLVVGHGAFISNALATWLGGHGGHWRDYDPHNCALTMLEQTATGWQGLVVNDISHLPQEARVVAAPDY